MREHALPLYCSLGLIRLTVLSGLTDEPYVQHHHHEEDIIFNAECMLVEVVESIAVLGWGINCNCRAPWFSSKSATTCKWTTFLPLPHNSVRCGVWIILPCSVLLEKGSGITLWTIHIPKFDSWSMHNWALQQLRKNTLRGIKIWTLIVCYWDSKTHMCTFVNIQSMCESFGWFIISVMHRKGIHPLVMLVPRILWGKQQRTSGER